MSELKYKRETVGVGEKRARPFPFLVGAGVAIVLIAVCILAIPAIGRAIDYRAASALMDEGRYDEAIGAFAALEGYSDSEERRTACELELARAAEVGEFIRFGTFMQQSGGIDREPVEWQVLDRQGDRLLVIRRYILLDGSHYIGRSGTWTAVFYMRPHLWDGSDLRKNLNGEFLENVFCAAEAERIPTAALGGNGVSGLTGEAAADTEDRIFLLSVAEVETYFDSPETRACTATAYALDDLANKADGSYCDWWLRTAVGDSTCYAFVSAHGTIDLYGEHDGTALGVRPAMWIDLGE